MRNDPAPEAALPTVSNGIALHLSGMATSGGRTAAPKALSCSLTERSVHDASPAPLSMSDARSTA